MAAIMPELAWALAFLVHGLVSMICLTQQTCNRYTFSLDATLGVLLWTSSTVACFAAHWTGSFSSYVPPAAMSGEIWIMVFSWWYFIRHWAELSLKRDTTWT
jgi:hypothetical protein